MNQDDWNFADFGGITAQVLPTLLLALVLTSELLPVIVAWSRQVERTYVDPPARLRPWLLGIQLIAPDTALNIEAMIWATRTRSIILFAATAELIALFGVVAPPSWYDQSVGRVFAFVLTAYVGWVVLFLITLLGMGLAVVVGRAERIAAAADGESAVGGGDEGEGQRPDS